MFKKITVPLLILLVFCQIGAVWTVFSTAIWIHQQNKQARLSDTSRWQVLVLSKTEFKSSLIDEHEIEIAGTLYDIVSTELGNDSVKVTAVADYTENKMKKTLSGLQKEETGWSALAKKIQAFSTTVYHPENNLRVLLPSFICEESHFPFADNDFRKGLYRIQEQPPAL